MSMSDQADDGRALPQGSPGADFSAVAGLLALVTDPAAAAGRLEELDRQLQAASAKLARAEKAWAAVEVKRGELEAWVAEQRAEITKAWVGHAQAALQSTSLPFRSGRNGMPALRRTRRAIGDRSMLAST